MPRSTESLLDRKWSLVAFDLDDTLAPSKSSLPPEMAVALKELLDVVPVAVISGGAFEQFEMQLLGGLGGAGDVLDALHLMPTCGTQYLRHEGGELVEVYAKTLTDDERGRAIEALTSQAKKLGLWEEHTWGDAIEDRGSQITFSALGQRAPLEAKRAWDPTGEKKARLATEVQERLGDLEVRSGGSTSVDITAAGVDKAYGMSALVQETGIPKDEMLFIGDRLDEGGNDYAVKAAGFATYPVAGWEETVQAIQRLVRAANG